MNESMGGTVTLVIIMFFIVFVSAYLAFNVNYMKAFRMKNKIISLYEEHQGDCSVNQSNQCWKDIIAFSKEIGYKPPNNFTCDSGYSSANYGSLTLYCYKENNVYKSSGANVVNDMYNYHYYSIYTKINISIPVFDNIMGKRLLSVSGDTPTFEIKK